MSGSNLGKCIAFIPFAGGSCSAFKAIRSGLPSTIDSIGIEYSGRYGSKADSPVNSVDRMADQVIDQLWRAGPAHLVLFGYSLGALVAYEVAHREHELPCSISEVVVAACRPPHLFNCQQVRLHGDDDDFLDSVSAFGTIPEYLFTQSIARKYLLPKLKNDFHAAQAYRHDGRPKLTTRLTAIGGDDDSFAPFEDIKGWRDHCEFGYSEHCLTGRHFFHEHQADTLSRILVDALSA